MFRSLLIVALALAAACDGAEPGDGVPAQGAPATNELAINEVSWSDDWVEIVNRSPDTLELANYFLTDSPDRLDHFLALEGQLGPGGLLVITPETFGLSKAEEVHVLTSTGLGVDGLSYLVSDADDGLSLARMPNAEGPFYLVSPTPGQEN